MDFWRKMLFDLREFGYYQIIQIVGGDHTGEYVYVKYDSDREFHDYMTLDEHNCVRHSCELYGDLMEAVSDESIKYFTSMSDCIHSILNDIYESDLDQDKMSELFRLLSTKLAIR